MKLPPRIRIKGVWYQVKYDKDMKDHDGDEIDGWCDDTKKTIWLSSELKNGQDRDDTFIHECFHAIFAELGLREVLQYQTEEIIVRNLATWLCSNYRLAVRTKKK